MARAKKKVAETRADGQTTSAGAEFRATSAPSPQGKTPTPARQARVAGPTVTQVPTSTPGLFSDRPSQLAKVPAPRKTSPALVAEPPVEVDPPGSPEEFGRRTPDLADALKELRSEVSDLRTQLASFRVEIEQARRKLKGAAAEHTRALDQGAALQHDVKSTRDSVATLGREVKQQLAELVTLIGEAREQSTSLSKVQGEIRGSLTQQGEELRSQMQADRREWGSVSREVELFVSRIRQEADKVGRDAGHSARGQRLEDQSLVREAPARPATREPSGVEIGHNRLGVTVDPCIVVAEVIPGSPGESAGLELGDVIDGVNGLPVRSGPELQDAITSIPPDDGVVITILRRGATLGLNSRTAGAGDQNGPISEVTPSLGVTVENGVVVSEVLPGTSASTAGLQSGDVITCINDEAVVSGVQLRKIIEPLPHRAEVKLQIARGTEVLEMPLHLDESARTSEGG